MGKNEDKGKRTFHQFLTWQERMHKWRLNGRRDISLTVTEGKEEVLSGLGFCRRFF